MLSEQIRNGLPEDLIPLIIQYACVSPSAEALYKRCRQQGVNKFEIYHVKDDEDGNEVPMTREDWDERVNENTNRFIEINVIEEYRNEPWYWFALLTEGMADTSFNREDIVENYHLIRRYNNLREGIGKKYAWYKYKELTDCPTSVH